MTGHEKWPRVVVVGGGYWGRNIVRNFAELGVLAGLVDQHHDIAQQLAAKHHTKVLGFAEAIADDHVGAVAVITPSPSHFELAKQALAAGKHVYVEKPMAMSRDEVNALVHLARDQNLVLMGGHILRYHPAFAHLHALVQASEIGTVRHVVSERLNLGKILKNEDAIWALSPHDLSMVQAVMGNEPEQVICHGDAFLREGVTDRATIRLVYSGKRSAEIRLSWMSPLKQQRLTVIGEKGALMFDDTRPWTEKLTLFKPELDWADAAVQPAPGVPQFVALAEGEPLKAECQHFLDCIAMGTKPITDGEESAVVVSLIERALSSLAAGGAPR